MGLEEPAEVILMDKNSIVTVFVVLVIIGGLYYYATTSGRFSHATTATTVGSAVQSTTVPVHTGALNNTVKNELTQQNLTIMYPPPATKIQQYSLFAIYPTSIYCTSTFPNQNATGQSQGVTFIYSNNVTKGTLDLVVIPCVSASAANSAYVNQTSFYSTIGTTATVNNPLGSNSVFYAVPGIANYTNNELFILNGTRLIQVQISVPTTSENATTALRMAAMASKLANNYTFTNSSIIFSQTMFT